MFTREFRFIAVAAAMLCAGTLLVPTATAQEKTGYSYSPTLPVSITTHQRVEIVVPDSFTVEKIEVAFSGIAHASLVYDEIREYSWAQYGIRLYHNGSQITFASNSCTLFSLCLDGLADNYSSVIFTPDPARVGASEKTDYSGSIYVDDLVNFQSGTNAQGSWYIYYDSLDDMDLLEISGLTLLFNGGGGLPTPPTNCSLSVPWYTDNAAAGQGVPANDYGVTSIVYLHNNLETDMTCYIEYYTQSGVYIGPEYPDNEFVIPANSTAAFRPAVNDPSTTPGGQEDPVGNAVPDRPMGTEGGNDNKKNGAIAIRWNGEPTDVQGIMKEWRMMTTGGVYSNGVTLPPGATTAK